MLEVTKGLGGMRHQVQVGETRLSRATRLQPCTGQC